MRTTLALVLCFGLAACAQLDDDGDLVADTVTEAAASDTKADQADLAIEPYEGLTLRASIGRTESGRVIRSPGSFKTAFGVAPPADLDFGITWLAVYSAGERSTGGYTAAITRVRLSDAGKTVKVVSALSTPGANCVTAQVVTKPVAIVKFAAQPGASHTYFTKTSQAVACGEDVTCGAQLDDELASITRGMLFTSESDYPLEPFDYTGAGAPTPDKIRALAGIPATAVFEMRSASDFFDHQTTVYDPGDPAALEYAARYQELRNFMEASLTDLVVYRFGEIQIGVYVVGVDACGNLIGFHTTAIET